MERSDVTALSSGGDVGGGGEAKTVAADLLGFPAQMANLKYESEKMHSDLIQILVSPHI